MDFDNMDVDEVGPRVTVREVRFDDLECVFQD